MSPLVVLRHAESRLQQMKSAQADAAKLQVELAATNFEGFSSDETVKATVDGSQARAARTCARRADILRCQHPCSRLKRAAFAARSPRGAISPKPLWNKAPNACLCSSTRRTKMLVPKAWQR